MVRSIRDGDFIHDRRGIVKHYPELLLCMLFLGIVLPIFSVVALYAITHDFPTQYAGILLGFRQGVIPLGGIMAGALFPMLIGAGLSDVLGGLGILTFLLTVLLILALWQLPDHTTDAPQRYPSSTSFLRTIIPISFVVFLMGAGQFSVLIFSLLYLGVLGIHVAWESGAFLVVFLSGGFVARIMVGFLAGRYFSLKALFIFVALIGSISMAIFATLPLHPDLLKVFILAFILGVGIVGYNALPFQWASELVAREQKGRAMGLLSAVSGLSVALWLPLFGFIVDLWGYSVMWFIVAALYAAVSMAILLSPNPGPPSN